METTWHVNARQQTPFLSETELQEYVQTLKLSYPEKANEITATYDCYDEKASVSECLDDVLNPNEDINFENTKNRRINKMLVSAAQAFKTDKNVEKAILAFEAVLELDPNNEDALESLVDVCKDNTHIAKMKLYAEKGLVINPNNTLFYNALAAYYLSEPNPNKAEQYALKSLEIDPTNPFPMIVITLKLFYEKEFEAVLAKLNDFIPKALTGLEKNDNAITRSSINDLYRNRAAIYLMFGNKEQGLKNLNLALECYDADIDTYLALAELMAQDGKFKKAQILVEHALNVIENYDFGIQLRVNHNAEDDNTEMLQQSEQITEIRTRQLLYRLAGQQNDYELLAIQLKKLMELDTENLSMYASEYYALLAQTGQYDELRSLLTKNESLATTTFEPLFLNLLILFHLQDETAFLETIDKILAHPEGLELAEGEEGRTEAYSSLLFLATDIFIESHVFHEGLLILTKLHETFPEFSELSVYLAWTYISLGQAEKAKIYIDEYMAKSDDPELANFVIASYYNQIQEHEKALEHAKVAAQNLENYDALKLLLLTLSQLEKTEEVKMLLDDRITLYESKLPNTDEGALKRCLSELYTLKEFLLSQEAPLSELEKYLKRALELNPQNAEANYHLGFINIDKKDYIAAIPCFENYLKFHLQTNVENEEDKDSLTLNTLQNHEEVIANVLSLLLQLYSNELPTYEERIVHLQELHNIMPANPSVARSLFAHFKHLKNWKEAETLCRQMLEMYPGEMAWMLNLIQATMNLNKHTQAIIVAEQYINNPNVKGFFVNNSRFFDKENLPAEVHFAVGMALFRTGSMKAGQYNIEYALKKLDPESNESVLLYASANLEVRSIDSAVKQSEIYLDGIKSQNLTEFRNLAKNNAPLLTLQNIGNKLIQELDLNPDSAKTYYLLAQLLHKTLNRTEGAIYKKYYYQKAYELDPTLTEVCLYLGDIYSAEKDVEKMQKYLTEGLASIKQNQNKWLFDFGNIMSFVDKVLKTDLTDQFPPETAPLVISFYKTYIIWNAGYGNYAMISLQTCLELIPIEDDGTVSKDTKKLLKQMLEHMPEDMKTAESALAIIRDMEFKTQ